MTVTAGAVAPSSDRWAVMSLAIALDDSLAVGSADNTVQLWRADQDRR